MDRGAWLGCALIAITVNACGLALGLGDFKDAPPDAGTGGAGGAATGGASGAATGGAGGTTLDGSAGTAGAAGGQAGRDGGSDAPTDAPATCTCLPPAPSGWTGPLALYDSSAAAPTCSAPWSGLMDGGKQFTGLPAKCTPCSCSVTTEPYCDVKVETANLGCTSGLDTTVIEGNNVCVPLTLSNGNGAAFVQAQVSDVAANTGKCSTNGGAPTPQTPAFTDHMRACKLSGQAPSCGSNRICAPPVPSGFPGGRYCIAKPDATATCPTSGAYTHAYTFATSLSDTRACSTCQCSIPSGSSVLCSQSTTVTLSFLSVPPRQFPPTACSGPLTAGGTAGLPAPFQGSTAQTCMAFSQVLAGGTLGPETPASAASAKAIDVNATCNVTSPSPSGTVTLDPTKTWVFCCTE